MAWGAPIIPALPQYDKEIIMLRRTFIATAVATTLLAAGGAQAQT